MILKHYFKQSQNFSVSIRLRISVIILFLCGIAAPLAIAQSEIHYSDQWADDSVEDELRAIGVGITEADYQSDAESYTIQTSLQSPTGVTTSVTSNGFRSVRAEVAMIWNLDYGNWLASSSHSGIFEQCSWDNFIGGYRCRHYRRFLALTSYYLGYADQGSQDLWYRKETQRLVADYCPYVICTIHEGSYCASNRRGISRYDGGGPGLDTCPAGYERDFKIVSVGDYRLFCWERRSNARFLSYNPC